MKKPSLLLWLVIILATMLTIAFITEKVLFSYKGTLYKEVAGMEIRRMVIMDNLLSQAEEISSLLEEDDMADLSEFRYRIPDFLVMLEEPLATYSWKDRFLLELIHYNYTSDYEGRAIVKNLIHRLDDALYDAGISISYAKEEIPCVWALCHMYLNLRMELLEVFPKKYLPDMPRWINYNPDKENADYYKSLCTQSDFNFERWTESVAETAYMYEFLAAKAPAAEDPQLSALINDAQIDPEKTAYMNWIDIVHLASVIPTLQLEEDCLQFGYWPITYVGVYKTVCELFHRFSETFPDYFAVSEAGLRSASILASSSFDPCGFVVAKVTDQNSTLRQGDIITNYNTVMALFPSGAVKRIDIKRKEEGCWKNMSLKAEGSGIYHTTLWPLELQDYY